MKHLLTQLLGGQAQRKIFLGACCTHNLDSLSVLCDYNSTKDEASKEQLHVTL